MDSCRIQPGKAGDCIAKPLPDDPKMLHKMLDELAAFLRAAEPARDAMIRAARLRRDPEAQAEADLAAIEARRWAVETMTHYLPLTGRYVEVSDVPTTTEGWDADLRAGGGMFGRVVAAVKERLEAIQDKLADPGPKILAEAEARWIEMERGGYSGDPETSLDILHGRWQAAEGDVRRRQEIARRSARWLLEELRACVRLGRSALSIAPAPGCRHGRGYEEMTGQFGWRVEECLRRAVAMAGHSQGAMTMEVAVAASVVEEQFAYVFGKGWDPESIEHSVDLLMRVEAILGAAYKAEYEPGDKEPLAGVAAVTMDTGPATPAPAPAVTFDFSAAAEKLLRTNRPKKLQADLVRHLGEAGGGAVEGSLDGPKVAHAVQGKRPTNWKVPRNRGDREALRNLVADTNQSLADLGLGLDVQLLADRVCWSLIDEPT